MKALKERLQRKETMAIHAVTRLVTAAVASVVLNSPGLESKISPDYSNFVVQTGELISEAFPRLILAEIQAKLYHERERCHEEDPRLARLKAMRRGESTEYNKYSNWLHNISRYEDLIEQAALEYDIPVNRLKALIAVESAGNPRAKPIRDGILMSSAAGLGQFIRSTGRKYNLHQTRTMDDRMNPFKAIPAVAQHLVDLNEIFNGNFREAVELGYHSNPPEWYFDRINKIEEGLNSGGLVYEKAPLFSEDVKQTTYRTVNHGETLKTIADSEGTTLKKLKYLNPQVINYNLVAPRDSIRVPIKKYQERREGFFFTQ